MCGITIACSRSLRSLGPLYSRRVFAAAKTGPRKAAAEAERYATNSLSNPDVEQRSRRRPSRGISGVQRAS